MLRRNIAAQLRHFITGEALSRTLTIAQQADLAALRKKILGDFDLIPEPYAYRYAERIPMPTIPNTDFLFLPGWPVKVYLPLVSK